MQRISKLIWGVTGYVMGFAFTWAATQFPGVVTCTTPDVAETCSVLGILTYAQANNIVALAFGAIGIYASPPNATA